MPSRIVLDSNIAAFAPIAEIEKLAGLGLPLSVSDVAFSETWARSGRSLSQGKAYNAARGKLFNRIPKLHPFVDPSYPIAVGGAAAIERARVATTADYLPPPWLADYVEHARERWHAVATGQIDDAEWLEVAQEMARFLVDADQRVAKLVRSTDEKLADRYPDEVERAAISQRIAQQPPEAIRTYTMMAIREPFGRDTADRLDAFVRVTAWRSLNANVAPRPQENDGADHRLLLHLAEGAVVLTNDNAFCELVDASGSPQAPWIRRIKDVEREGLPPGLPWGDSAIAEALKFRREGLSKHPQAWPIAAPPYDPNAPRIDDAELDT